MKPCGECGAKTFTRFLCWVPDEGCHTPRARNGEDALDAMLGAAPRDPDGFPESKRRCYACHIAHAEKAHGVKPEPKVCTICKKDLGFVPPAFSKAGAPWCGECPTPIWWSQ